MPFSGIELLAGTRYSHAIEVQDFSCYVPAIDIRSHEEFGDNHISGCRAWGADYIDAVYAEEMAGHSVSRHRLNPLVVDSMAHSALKASVQLWSGR